MCGTGGKVWNALTWVTASRSTYADITTLSSYCTLISVSRIYTVGVGVIRPTTFRFVRQIHVGVVRYVREYGLSKDIQCHV